MLVMVFGIVFQLPILTFFLTKIGLLTPEFMRQKRRYGIVLIVAAAAILTPPDVFTQLMLALPLVVLYEVSIWVCKWSLPRSESID
jgi:sec-independent protein translocase protein TatC